MKKLWIFYLFWGSLLSLETSTFSGKAYDEKHNHLFTEEYVIEKEANKVLNVTTRFLSPKGQLLGELSSEFPDSPYLPRLQFSTTDALSRYGALTLEKSIHLFKNHRSASTKTKTIPLKANMTAGPGFYFYIVDNLDELLKGHPLQMVFLQPNRLSSYTFNMKAFSLSSGNIKVTLTIDSPLLKALVPEIHLTLDPHTKSLVSYEGINGFFSDDHLLKKIHIDYTQPQPLLTNPSL